MCPILRCITKVLMSSARFYKLLLYLGLGVTDCKEIKIHQFCKNVSEFALEYRTTREKVLQQHAKKKSYKERKKTRGKLIVDVSFNPCKLYLVSFTKSMLCETVICL